MYSPEAFAKIAAIPPIPGMAMYFKDGYLYGLDDGKLVEYNMNGHGPGPYYAKVVPGDALKSFKAWEVYMKKWRLGVVHHKLKRCKRSVPLAGRHFCGLLHTANVTRSWENRNLLKRLGPEVEEKENVLVEYGITA
jgi:hypothetical protein